MARSTSSNSWEGVERLAKAAGAQYPALVAAQWALESGWGKQAPGNNFFGLKGKGQVFTTTEVQDGETVVVGDEFLTFDSLKTCVTYLVDRWHKDWGKYQGVNHASCQETAARELQRQGYATNPRYADHLIELMREHGKTHESKPQGELLWLRAKRETFLKKSVDQADALGVDEKVRVVEGRVYGVLNLVERAADAHAEVELAADAGTWFLFMPHWDITQKGAPPLNGKVNWADFSCQVTPNLTVGEVLQFDKRRIPQAGSGVERRLLATAAVYQGIRDAWGQPLGVTSFYRPEPINQQVGGVPGSRHVTGEAFDVYPLNRSLESFYQWIRLRWTGGLGDGRPRGFVHIDTRNGGRFVPGAGVRPYAEWMY